MANLSFFGSTVDAIAPQEQNVLSQYRQHNWQVEQANAAAAERARQLSMAAFANAQQNEQHQAQQDYANRVNLLQFAERARGSRVAEGLAAKQIEAQPMEQAYQDAERMAEYAAPETLDRFFGATVPRSRLNILKEFARTRSKETEKETAAQKQDLLFQITSRASKGELPFPVAEVSTMFGLPETDVKPAYERGQKMFSDLMVQKMNAATAKAKLNAMNAFEKQARKSPDLMPNEIEAIRQSIGGAPSTARYDLDKGQWTIEPEDGSSFSPVLGDVRQSESGVNLSRFAPMPATRPLSPGTRLDMPGVNPQSQPRIDLSQFRTGTNAPVVTAPAVIAPTATLAPALKAAKLAEARRAISLGANPQQVAERLRQRYGITLE